VHAHVGKASLHEGNGRHTTCKQTVGARRGTRQTQAAADTIVGLFDKAA
jgi:hypothetical protein